MLDFTSYWYTALQMHGRAAKRKPYALQHVSDLYKTQEICDKTHEKEPYVLEHFPYECNTQKM